MEMLKCNIVPQQEKRSVRHVKLKLTELRKTFKLYGIGLHMLLRGTEFFLSGYKNVLI